MKKLHKKQLTYFSTFSGIGGFEAGIKTVFNKPLCVGFSEIDKYATKIYLNHFSDHKNYGDITKIDIPSLPDFDLLVGGSPCQDLSNASKYREGLSGTRSSLFFKFVEILREKLPRYFILENVHSMSHKNRDKMSSILEVEPVVVNASLVSAQNRKRLFWSNFPISQPVDRGILLRDILDNFNERYIHKEVYSITRSGYETNDSVPQIGQAKRVYNPNGKIIPLNRWAPLVRVNGKVRKLTVEECARLQGFPDNWCYGIPKTEQYKCYGNAVNVTVVEHIMNDLKLYIHSVGGSIC